MAITAGITITSNKMTQNLQGMIERGRSPRAFLQRVAYPMYQARQMKRWVTQGESEDQNWPNLNKKYAEWKRINFAGFPGNGERMMILTGRLAESVIGYQFKGQELSEEVLQARAVNSSTAAGHFVMVTDQSLTIGTSVEYAGHANAARNMWSFKPDFSSDLKKRFSTWFSSGKVQ